MVPKNKYLLSFLYSLITDLSVWISTIWNFYPFWNTLKNIDLQGFSKVFIPFGHWFWGQMVVLDNYVDKMQSILWYLTHIFRKFHWDLFIMVTATAFNVIRGQIQILHGFISLISLRRSFLNLCFGLRNLICITY